MSNHSHDCVVCGGDLRAGDCICAAKGNRHLYAEDYESPCKENPKLIQALKAGKAPLEYLVLSVLEGDARVHKSGADKYGIRNWLIDKIKASTYVAAILRHLVAWALGQDIDPESGESHLYHIRACCAILIYSKAHGTLIDDRLLVESKDQG